MIILKCQLKHSVTALNGKFFINLSLSRKIKKTKKKPFARDSNSHISKDKIIIYLNEKRISYM